MLKETYFLLPKIENIIIDPILGDRTSLLDKLGYNPKLNQTKNKISDIKYSKWTKLRKLVNDFEFPHDPSKIKKPISRAFFKLLEIYKDHDIKINSNTLHLAEAPGGFIETTLYVKNKQSRKSCKHYTFSIVGDLKVPVYNRQVIKNKDVIVLSNNQNKGDLYDVKNIQFLIKHLADKDIRIITCDGGFTENCEFAAKEKLHHKLIFNEIITSIFILSNAGYLILKNFDVFTELTFDFIYLLSYLFEEVYICKPHSSRPTNSEKYIFCKNFKKSRLDSELQSFLKKLCSDGIEKYKTFIHKGNIDGNFIEKMKNINEMLMNYQIYHINNIIQINSLNLKIVKSKENIKEWIDKYC